MEQNQDGCSSKKEIQICWMLTELNHRFCVWQKGWDRLNFMIGMGRPSNTIWVVVSHSKLLRE